MPACLSIHPHILERKPRDAREGHEQTGENLPLRQDGRRRFERDVELGGGSAVGQEARGQERRDRAPHGMRHSREHTTFGRLRSLLCETEIQTVARWKCSGPDGLRRRRGEKPVCLLERLRFPVSLDDHGADRACRHGFRLVV